MGSRAGPGNGFNAPQGVLLFEELCFLTEIPAGSCNNSNERLCLSFHSNFTFINLGPPELLRTKSARRITARDTERILYAYT